MPKGEVFFKKVTGVTYDSNALHNYSNGKFVQSNSGVWVDAYIQWGVSFSDGSLSNLLTPPATKNAIENESRLEHGKRVVTKAEYVKMSAQDVSLDMNLTARNKTEFFQRYDSFCKDVLAKGFVEIINAYLPDRVFKLSYKSCSQFRAYIDGLARFTLKMTEPNPMDRSI